MTLQRKDLHYCEAQYEIILFHLRLLFVLRLPSLRLIIIQVEFAFIVLGNINNIRINLRKLLKSRIQNLYPIFFFLEENSFISIL
jgi:hypothetical protein